MRRAKGQRRVLLDSNGMLDVRSPPTHIAAIATHNSQTSPLLRLPTKVRHKIFERVIAMDHIHIRYSEARAERRASLGSYFPNSAGLTFESWPTPWSKALTDVHKVCRQLYQETCLQWYSRSVFHFCCLEVRTLWLESLTMAQKGAIRRVVLEKGYTFELPNSLTGLKEIRDNTNAAIDLQWDERLGWVMTESRKGGGVKRKREEE